MRSVVLTSAAGAALTALLLLAYVHGKTSDRSLEGALQDSGVQETVTAGDRTFEISGQDIVASDGAPISKREARSAREVAYALALARHAPILGIPGTDPAELERAVDELAKVLESLAVTQETEDDAHMALALYPIDFLRSLAELERRRISFIGSGSESDAQRYHEQLAAAIEQYSRDSSRFSEYFAAAIPENARIPSFGGTITAPRLREALRFLELRGLHMHEEHERRLGCLRGERGTCETASLMPPQFETTDRGVLATPDTTRDILAFRADIYGGLPPETDVVLAESVCLETLPAPYFFAASATDEFFRVRFVGDLFFARTSGSEGPTMRHLRDLGIEYAILNPMNYYTCPDIQHDTGRIRAILAIRAFAERHPEIAAATREALLRDPVSESNAEAYLDEILGTSPRDLRNEIDELALMYTRRTAGLESVVRDSADITRNDLRLTSENVPFDMRIRKLYISHSAFPSFYLAYAGDERIDIYERPTERDASAFADYALRFSELRESVGRDELLDDVRAFLRFEGRLP